jgi:hypothetical protein
VLVAVTGRGEMLSTGEVITIKDNTLRAKWGASDYSNGLSGVLQPPNYPQSPVNSIEVRHRLHVDRRVRLPPASSILTYLLSLCRRLCSCRRASPM